MKDRKVRVLVADDEAKYVQAIQINLRASDYEVLVARDGEMAVALAASDDPDLVLLDVRMPTVDGLEACRRIRDFSNVPIIMLTAASAEADKVRGLDAGADDYITKPFGASELMSRVKAALRRAQMEPTSKHQPVFEAGRLRIDYVQKRVFADEKEVKLTSTEYRLLCQLVKWPGRVLVPEFLLNEVWGDGYQGDTHLLWQVIHRLRQKIEADPQNPIYIQTRSGVGYMFTSPDS